ncbi:37062_t:CDS:2, partial [Gigaspora margarita]
WYCESDNEFEMIKERRIRRIRNKKNDYKGLLQEVLSICNSLSREMNQRKGENIGMNAALELEDLVINLIKDSSEKILPRNRRNEIEKDKKEIYLDSSRTFEVDNEETWRTKKDKK